MESIAEKAIKKGTWLALCKFVSQFFSWSITILVARLLTPEDYGLMAQATIISGYAMMFNELGLGAAIIQKPTVNDRELSSVFWFAFSFGSILACACFLIAYPTAWIFNEPRVIPLTQVISILFLTASLQIIPLNILKKELEFKAVGVIELVGIVLSSLSMYLLALFGAGVWTLIGGHIIRDITKVVLLYGITKWYPKLSFNYDTAKAYIGFGLSIAASRSLYYAYDKSDRFFAGRRWSSTDVGYYSFALQLAKIPVEKIVVLINQISFSVFSKFQSDEKEFNHYYLSIIKVTACVVFPIFIGLYLIADDLIRLILTPQWYVIIFLFKMLCLIQILTSINAINGLVHIAKGNTSYLFFFNIAMATLLPISFYFSVTHRLNLILLPWFTTYFILCIFWIVFTIRKCKISSSSYLKSITSPMVASLIMAAGVQAGMYLLQNSILDTIILRIISSIFIGVIIYLSVLWITDRNIFIQGYKLIRKKEI